MTRTEDLIVETIGQKPTMFRPPYGHASAAVLNLLHDLGYTHSVEWDIDSVDYAFAQSQPERIPQNVLNKVNRMDSAKSGAIILLHNDLQPSFEAVRPMLEVAAAKGLRMVSIRDCHEFSTDTGNTGGTSTTTGTPTTSVAQTTSAPETTENETINSETTASVPSREIPKHLVLGMRIVRMMVASLVMNLRKRIRRWPLAL